MSGTIFRHLRREDHRVMPWRNGRGMTLEFAREDDAAGELLWRVSRADVIEPGDFSLFPGIDRILMLVEGAGFDLDFGAGHGRAAAEPFQPIRFAGEWPTRAENVRGTSRDLNVMAARGRVSPALSVHRATFEQPSAARSLYIALGGAWRLAAAGKSYELEPDDALLVTGDPIGIHGDGDGVLAAIDLR